MNLKPKTLDLNQKPKTLRFKAHMVMDQMLAKHHKYRETITSFVKAANPKP